MPRSLRGPVSRNRWATTDWNALAQSALLLLGVAPGRHRLWRGGKKKRRGGCFQKVSSIYELDLWTGRSGRRNEEREVTGERSLACVLARDERGFFSPSQLFHDHRRDRLTHTQTLCPYIYMHTQHSHTHTKHTHTHTYSETPADRGAEVTFTIWICPALVETHICEYFSSAGSASQWAAEQKGPDRRWVEAGRRRCDARVPQKHRQKALNQSVNIFRSQVCRFSHYFFRCWVWNTRKRAGGHTLKSCWSEYFSTLF